MLAVRPNAVRLSTNGDGLDGRIAHAAYLGGRMEYGIQLPGIETEPFAIVPNVTTPHHAGQAVRVTVDSTGIAVVYPEYKTVKDPYGDGETQSNKQRLFLASLRLSVSM